MQPVYTADLENRNDNSGQEQHSVVILDELASQIREADRAVRAAESNSVDSAYVAGERVLKVRGRVPNLRRWLEENGFAVSTMFLYLKLFLNREKVEVARKDNPHLSLRAAVRLIGKKRAGAKTSGKKATGDTPDDIATVLAVLEKVPAAAVTAALEKRGFVWFLKLMPASWIPLLMARVAHLPRESDETDEPFLRGSEVLRRALSLAKIATDAKTTPAVAAANEKEAVTALRQLNFVLAGAHIDTVTIVRKHAKANRCAEAKKKHRRAA
jgi:hypothetical protein